MHPDFVSGVVPIEQMAGDDSEDTALLHAAYEEARAFLLSQKWCFGIGEVYFGDGVGGVVAIFLMQIHPVPTGVDQWLWIVVGDIPPAYLVLDDCHTPLDALKTYIGLMREWVALALQGKQSEKVIPVSISATPENAELLESRLDVLTDFIVPHFAEKLAI